MRRLDQLSVLLCEDVEDLRYLFRLFLEVEGAVVHEASDGFEAIDAARTGCFDLALVDIGLPDISGLIVGPQIKESCRTRIAMSGYVDDALRSQAQEAGFCAVLPKPVYMDDVVAVCELGKKGGP
jgi:CheY-like chemotaxis protein